ncbi:MAG: hypothetical protein IKI50_06685 [Clostridia bacterium]|nr:hypothetical protein [Clostridia bacterium]
MKQVWRACTALLLGVLLLWNSGCGFPAFFAEEFFAAPRGSGEQEGLLQALEAYLAQATGQDQPEYRLKYPQEGADLTAFVFLDADGAAACDAAVFYTCPAQSARARLLYLHKQDGVWAGVCDLEGRSETVRSALPRDLDGDGVAELLVGWDLYNARDGYLTVYSIAPQNGAAACRALYETLYTSLLTADMDGQAGEELLLLHILHTEHHVSARLAGCRKGELREWGGVRLDGSIIRFTGFQAAVLADGTHAVFADGVKDGGSLLTELIVWNGETLSAPLYHADSNQTTLTVRESGLPSADVDHDGVPEWPVSQRLPGYESCEPAQALYQTTYYQWDGGTASARPVLTALVNGADGYMIVLGNDLRGRVTAAYDPARRLYEVRRAEDGAALLRVICAADGAIPPDYLRLMTRGTAQYGFWVPADGDRLISEEQARYMITFLS